MRLTKISLQTSNILRKAFFVFILGMFFFANISYGQQSKRDSLIQLLHRTNSTKSFSEKDSTHVDILNQLGRSLRFYKADSLLRVAEQALNHSKAIEYTKGHVEALVNIGDYYSDKGNHDKAISNYKVALKIAKETNKTSLNWR